MQPATSDRETASALDAALEDLLRYDPVLSSTLGHHAHDGAFMDLSVEGQRAHRHALAGQVHVLEQRRSPCADLELDRAMLLDMLRVTLRVDEDLCPAQRSPALFAGEVLQGLDALLWRPPFTQRIGALLGRLREVPHVLRQAEDALSPTEVPRLWAEVGITMARAGLSLLTETIPARVHECVGHSPMAAALINAAGEAALALGGYANFVEAEVLPVAAGDFAVGESLIAFLLHHLHGFRYTPDHVFATAEEEVQRLHGRLTELAGGPWQGVLRAAEGETFLPDDSSLPEVCQRLLVEVRQRAAALFPPLLREEALLVRETPSFARVLAPLLRAWPPPLLATLGPATDEPLTGHLWITPGHRVTREELLLACLQEGVPGMHLLRCHSTDLSSRVRRVMAVLGVPGVSGIFGDLGGPAMAMGWGLYCEGQAEAIGLAADRLRMLLLRSRLQAALLMQLDVALHCRGLSVEDAARRLVQEGAMAPGLAQAAVRRITLEPSAAMGAYLGFLAHEQLRAQAERKPDFSPAAYHGQIFKHGPLAPAQLHERL